MKIFTAPEGRTVCNKVSETRISAVGATCWSSSLKLLRSMKSDFNEIVFSIYQLMLSKQIFIRNLRI